MYQYTSTNLCFCQPASSTPVPPSDPCDDCLIASSFATDCETSTPPGGSAGVLDLTEYNNYGGCVDDNDVACPLTYTLLSYDTEALTNVVIDANGLLGWETTNDAIPGSFVEIHYVVYCTCNNLSAQAVIRVCIRNLCATVLCPVDETCVAGVCVPNINAGVL